MEDIITTEHCFNLNDAKHTEGTNRYIFDYPEIWYTNQTMKDMSLGIRSIILKPAPVEIRFWNLFVKGNNPVVQESVEGSTEQIIFGHHKIVPNEMYLDFNKHVDEKVDMLEFVNWANSKMISDFDRHADVIYSANNNFKLLDLDRYSVWFKYSTKGTFKLRANDYCNLCIKIQEEEYQENKIGVATFTRGFHQMLGLNYDNEKTNINTYLSAIANVLRKNPTNKTEAINNIKAEAEKNGIIIHDGFKADKDKKDKKGEYILTECIQLEADKNTKYKVGEVDHYRLYNFLFGGIEVKNVWSRKDVLLTSSVSEADKRGYIGFSSNYSNSAQAVYPQPKMYPVSNTNSKFWVELFDSYTQKAINMDESNLLLIEAVIFQKPKRTFTRT